MPLISIATIKQTKKKKKKNPLNETILIFNILLQKLITINVFMGA